MFVVVDLVVPLITLDLVLLHKLQGGLVLLDMRVDGGRAECLLFAVLQQIRENERVETVS